MRRPPLRSAFLLGVLAGLVLALARALAREPRRTPAPLAAPPLPLPPVTPPDRTPVPVEVAPAPAAEPEPVPTPEPVIGPGGEPTDLITGSGEGPAEVERAEPEGDAEGVWVAPVEGGCPEGYPIKAKVSSGIFHRPGGLSYERTRPDRCYPTEAAAEADGFRAAKR